MSKSFRHKHPLIFGIGGCCLLLASALVWQTLDKIALIAPPATALIEDRYGSFVAEGRLTEAGGFGYWDVPAALPEKIVSALLMIEDKRFYQHYGVDFRSLLRALWYNLTHRSRQGASSVAMQVARMQYPGNRNYWNKICEGVIAIGLTIKFGHQAVLHHYLKIVPQGNRIHGVNYAARRYLYKPLADLSWAEAAILASLPKAPGSMNLYRPEGFDAAKRRAKLILYLLYKNDHLNKASYSRNKKQLFHLKQPVKTYRLEHNYHAILRMQNRLRKQELDVARPVHTGLDLLLQTKLAAMVNQSIDKYRSSGAGNMAIIVAEKDSGQVVGYIGSNAYSDSQHNGAINHANLERSSGSTLKPFIYALGLQTKTFTPQSMLQDQPLRTLHPDLHYNVQNYDEHYLGPILYRKALANSRNIPAVHVLKMTGLQQTYQLIRSLGLVKDARPAHYYGLGLAIGGLYVSLEDLVSAYGVLANDGKAYNLRWFKTEKPVLPEQLISKDVARQISLFLADPQARLPSFARMSHLEFPFPVAIKTGTSQGYRDAWAIAYTSKYIVGTWIGHAQNTRMKQINGMQAAGFLQQVILMLHPQEARGINATPFPAPKGYQPVRLCTDSGHLADHVCPEVILEYLPTKVVTEALRITPQNMDVKTIFNTLPQSSERFYDLTTILDDEPMFFKRRYQLENQSTLDLQSLWHSRIDIIDPFHGSRYFLNPEAPMHLQTIALQARVVPNIDEIIWYVDGKPFKTAAFPYAVRWPLNKGTHTIYARFANADVISNSITITVVE